MCPLSLQPYQSNAAEERSKQSAAIRGHILFVFALILVLVVAWHMRSVLELVYVSGLFAVVLTPIVKQVMRLRIHKWSPSKPVAVIALVLSVFVSLGVFLILTLPPVVRDIQRFTADIPKHIPEILDKLQQLPLVDRLNFDNIANKSENIAASAAQYLLASAPLWLHRIFDLIAAFVLCIYFMLEGDLVYYYLLSLVSLESRERLAKTLVTAQTRMSKWLIGQGALMVSLGVCSTIAFAALHVRYFFLLGVLMGLFNIIPIVGGLITILLVAAIAAVDSLTKMAGVFIFYIIYIQIENSYLIPRIMRSRVHLMGLSVLIALLAGTELAGVVGALVAVPTAALIAVITDEYFVQRDAAEALAANAAAQAAQAAQAAAQANTPPNGVNG